MPSFVSNSSHLFHIDASSARPCTNNTGNRIPPAVLVSGGRLAMEAKAATPIAIAITAIAITITNFLLTKFLCADVMLRHLILS